MTSVIEARQRLDKTLASSALSDTATICSLVRKQQQKSSSGGGLADKVVEKKSKQLFALLEALRSAKGERTTKVVDGEWKVKQDTSRFRVMYREGPEGTPFHSLCLDGIIDGPMSSALVVGWEAPLYKEWWPQFTAPAFKIVESQWLQKTTVAGDLSLLRIKVPWPLAMREVVLSSYQLDYFDEDMVAVLYSTRFPKPWGRWLHSWCHRKALDEYGCTEAPDEPDEEVDGISKDQVPKLLPHVVRMDLAGGFVLQKISPDCNFFRIVVDLDMKLDLVPPWLINFIARQLVGHGYKLYQKAVEGVKGSPFEKLVNSEPMYKRIQAAVELMSPNLYEPTLVPMMPLENDMPLFFKEPFKQVERDFDESIHKVLSDQDAIRKQGPEVRLVETMISTEALGQDPNVSQDNLPVYHGLPSVRSESPLNRAISTSLTNGHELACISRDIDEQQLRPDVEVVSSTDPEVVWALEVLNKLIAHFNAKKVNSETSRNRPQSVPNGKLANGELLISTGTLHEVRVSSNQGQESSLQSPTLEHVMYGSGGLQTAALDLFKDGDVFANGSLKGTGRQTGGELLVAKGDLMNSKKIAGRKVADGKPKVEDVQKVYRFFQPFKFRKKRKEGKPQKEARKLLQ